MSDPDPALMSPVAALVGREPGWIVRAGHGLLAFFLLSLIGLAAWIPYPQVLQARILIATEQPPVTLIAPQDTPAVTVHVRRGDHVEAGETLAILTGLADSEAIQSLYRSLTGYDTNDIAHAQFEHLLLAYRGRRLGEVRSSYDALLSVVSEFQFMQRRGFAADRMRVLARQQTEAQQQRQQLVRQRATVLQSLQLEQRQLARMRTLHERGVIAAVEVGRAEQRVLDKQFQYDEIELRVAALESDLNSLEQQRLQTQEHYDETHHRLLGRMTAAYEQLLVVIQQWRQQHVLQAPIAGEVVFDQGWAEHQFINRGTPLMTIVPAGQTVNGQMLLAESGAGEVKTGQRVQIELESHPATEHGYVIGRVQHVAPIVQDNHYSVTVSLPEGLITHRGIHVPLTANMQGNARIQVQRYSLLQRLFQRVLHIG